MRKSVAIQAVGYLVLLALLYAWFGIADRNVWQLALSVLWGLVIFVTRRRTYIVIREIPEVADGTE